MGEKSVKSKKGIYGLFMLTVFSVILTVSLCLAFSPLGDSHGSNILSAGLLSSSDGRSAAEVKITADEAIEIAMPLAEQYAKENNRTITTVEATLRNSTQPYWFIEIGFEAMETRGYHDRSSAYEVSVWADTGGIGHHGPIWINAWRGSPSNSDENIKITVDEAIEIAMPLAEQYAKENNRTITTVPTVEATLSNYADESRPSWHIDIKFKAVKNGEQYWKDTQYWIDAYQVSVWADTGEIRSHNARGWY